LVAGTEVVTMGLCFQGVVVESTAPICRVYYCCMNVDGASRQDADNTADPRLFERCDEAIMTGNRFSANYSCTTRSGLFHKDRVRRPAQLVVYIDFTNGTRACRVVDLPIPGNEEALVVHFP
jgi:hypothetical protein